MEVYLVHADFQSERYQTYGATEIKSGDQTLRTIKVHNLITIY